MRRFSGPIRRPVGRDTVANRILIRKEPIGECLIDDHHRLASIHIVASDSAAAYDPNAHRLEVAARDRAETCQRRNYAGRQRFSFDQHGIGETAAGKRQTG